MTAHVMTTLEARVREASWGRLRAAFESVEATEPGLLFSYLVQATADPELWRIVTIWRDRAALMAMRDAGTPRGVLMFREAGAEPSLLVTDVVGSIAAR